MDPATISEPPIVVPIAHDVSTSISDEVKRNGGADLFLKDGDSCIWYGQVIGRVHRCEENAATWGDVLCE